MNEREALEVLLVRAIEEADPAGHRLALAARRSASTEAAGVARIEEGATPARIDRFIAERARALLSSAQTTLPELARLAYQPHWRWWMAAIVLGAFVIGMASNALGHPQRLNLLTAPIALFIVWNAVMYLYLFFRWCVRMIGSATRGKAAQTEALRAPWLTRALARWHAWGATQPARSALAHWIAQGSALHRSRAMLAWHVAAAALAIGALMGMYLRGLGVDYTAMWESTFLDAHTVHRLLQGLLGTGAALLGTTVPDADQIAAMRWQGGTGGERAARWIHLYAASAVAIIVIPRLVLAAGEAIGVRKRSRAFPLSLEDDYFRRIVAVGGARVRSLIVVPCSVTPDPAFESRVRAQLEQVLGVPVDARFAAPVPYGESSKASTDVAAGDRVLVFSLATTPEHEVHGPLLEAGRPLAVLVDELSFAQRFRGESTMQRRIDERRTAWRDFCRGYGIDPVFVPATPIADTSNATTADTR